MLYICTFNVFHFRDLLVGTKENNYIVYLTCIKEKILSTGQNTLIEIEMSMALPGIFFFFALLKFLP